MQSSKKYFFSDAEKKCRTILTNYDANYAHPHQHCKRAMRERNFKQILFIISFQHNTSAQDSDQGDEEDEIFCRQAPVPTNQVLQSLSLSLSLSLSFKTFSPSSGSHTTWRTWWSSTARATPIWSFGWRCSSADNYHGQWACFLHWYITWTKA